MSTARRWPKVIDAVIAIVGQCGVLNAWQNGLHRDKINLPKKCGYNRNVRVRCVAHRFAYWTSVM